MDQQFTETAGGTPPAADNFSMADVFSGANEPVEEGAHDTGGGTSSGANTQSAPAPATQQQTTQTQAPPPSAPAAAPTAEQIAEQVASRLAPPQQGQQPKQYTREELDQMFNVYQPQADLITAIREGDEAGAIQAIATLRDGLIKQANTLAQYQMTILRDELLQQVAPALQSVAMQHARQQEEAFYTANPDLNQRRELVKTVYAAMRNEGTRFSTPQEASKALADRVRALAGLTTPTQPPGGSLPASSQQQQPQGQGARPAALGGGGSGAAASPGGSASGNVFADIFS